MQLGTFGCGLNTVPWAQDIERFITCHVQSMASRSLGSLGAMNSPSQKPTRKSSRLVNPNLRHSCTASHRYMPFSSACTTADAALSYIRPLLEELLRPTLWCLLALIMTRWGRAGQGRAGQGRRDKVCISKPQTMPETGQGRQYADRQHYSEHAHLSRSPQTPIKSASTVEGESIKKQRWREKKRIEQDKEAQDWQKIHVGATRNGRLKRNAADSPAPNRRAATGPSQRTPWQMPLALGWGASAGHTSPP